MEYIDSNIDIEKLKSSNFNPWKLVLRVLIAMLLIPLFSTQYATGVFLPLYCKNPQQTLYYLREVLTQNRPAGNESRRSYIIATKLVFLIPQQPEESKPDYLSRVEMQIQKTCQ